MSGEVKNYSDMVDEPATRGGGKWKVLVVAVAAIAVIALALFGGLSSKAADKSPVVVVRAVEVNVVDESASDDSMAHFVMDLRVANASDETVSVSDLPKMKYGVNLCEAVATDGSVEIAPGAETIVRYEYEVKRTGADLGMETGKVRYDGFDGKKFTDETNKAVDRYNDSLKPTITFNPDASEADDGALSSVSQSATGSEPSVSAEYAAALKTAKGYAYNNHMSRDGIYDQLVSNAEKFPPDAAQYAIDNLDVDWNKNALETARMYRRMGMSTAGVYDQLVSNAERFTPEQAQYAIDNLDG